MKLFNHGNYALDSIAPRGLLNSVPNACVGFSGMPSAECMHRRHCMVVRPALRR